MAQQVEAKYEPGAATEPLSKIINRHFTGIMRAAIYSGLKPIPGSAAKLSISAGVALTEDGCRVAELASKLDELSVPANSSGNPRWDAICLTHLYQTVDPMPAAYYQIEQGTPAADPALPSLPANSQALGYGLILDGETEYEKIVLPPRIMEGLPVIEVGDGKNFIAPDYNGVSGLLTALDAFKDDPLIVRYRGVFEFSASQQLIIPSGKILQGFGPASRLLVDDPITFKGVQSSGTTGTGTNVLTDATVDFTQYSKLSIVEILDGSEVGIYRILKKADGSVVLDINGTFTGESVDYVLYATGIVFEGGSVEPNDAAKNAIELDNCYDVHILHNMLDGTAKYGINDASDYAANILIAHNHISGTYNTDFAIKIAGDFTTPGGKNSYYRVVDNYCADLTIKNDKAGLIIRGNVGTVSNSAVGAGDPTFPFSTDHTAGGTHKNEVIDTAHLVDEAVETAKIKDDAVTNAKIADDAVDTAQLADEAVESDKIKDDAVGANKIAGASITTGHLIDGIVTQAKLATRFSLFCYNDDGQTGIAPGLNGLTMPDNSWVSGSGAVTLFTNPWKIKLYARDMILRVSAHIFLSADNGWQEGERAELRLYKNDAHLITICSHVCDDTVSGSINFAVWGCVLVNLADGDELELRLWHNNSNTLTTPASSADKNWVCVEEV